MCKATQVEFQYALPRRIFRDNWRICFSANCVLCVRNRFLYFLKLILTNRVEAAAEETHLERNQQLVPKAVNFFEEILSLCPTVAWCTQTPTGVCLKECASKWFDQHQWDGNSGTYNFCIKIQFLLSLLGKPK